MFTLTAYGNYFLPTTVQAHLDSPSDPNRNSNPAPDGGAPFALPQQRLRVNVFNSIKSLPAW